MTSELNDAAEQASRNVLLTVMSRVLSVVTPLVFAPFLYWSFNALYDNQLALVRMNERVIQLERNDQARELQSHKLVDKQDTHITDMVQRMSVFESQMRVMSDSLERISNQLDRADERREQQQQQQQERQQELIQRPYGRR